MAVRIVIEAVVESWPDDARSRGLGDVERLVPDVSLPMADKWESLQALVERELSAISDKIKKSLTSD